jgi:class 3 adenylate cyclase
VRPILSGIETPALLVHRSDAELIPSEAMQWLADALPNGRYAGVPGDQITGYLGDVDALMDEIEEFLHGTRLGSTASSQVITVLFTDVVGSTERVSEVGDRQWHRLLESHREEARLLLGRWGGREVGTSGDGLFAVFDAPTPAIRCALAMCASSQSGGLDIRAGIHTGEVEVDGADFIGLGVHLGSRVMSLAGAGEVLVSQTVRDLVMGSGFDMVSRGRHELKGVPGTWEVFGVAG